MRAKGYVYFFRVGNAVKIGFSIDLNDRQSTLLTACPEPGFIAKFVAGTTRTEREFHRRFAEYRTRGEWFDLRGKLAKYLERHIYPIDLPPRVMQPTECEEEIRL